MNGDTRGHVADDDGSHSHSCTVAKLDMVSYDRAHPDVDVRSDPDVAGDVRPGTERRELADVSVVSDEGTAAEYDTGADRRDRAHDHARRHDRARTDSRGRSDVCPRVDDRRQLEAGGKNPVGDRAPGDLARPDDDRKAPGARLLEPGHRKAVDRLADTRRLERL